VASFPAHTGSRCEKCPTDRPRPRASSLGDTSPRLARRISSVAPVLEYVVLTVGVLAQTDEGMRLVSRLVQVGS